MGTWHIRAYAPSIAQGEGMSLGEWRNGGIFSASPHHPSNASKIHHQI